MTNVNDIFVDTFYDIFGQTEPDDVTPPDESPLTQYPSGQQILDAAFAATAIVTRRAEILNADGTVYYAAPELIGGSVTVDASREERRILDIEFNSTGCDELNVGIGSLWYDKIIVPYRGIETRDKSWEWPLGRFQIDQIESDHFPHVVRITGRDFTKKLMLSKLSQSTTFTKGQSISAIIRAEAALAGVVNVMLPWNDELPSPQLDQNFAFERGTDRWKIIKDLCMAFNMEVFFNPMGFLVVRPFRDPLTTPSVLTLATGPEIGNLVRFTKLANDSRLYNRVMVIGESQGRPPVFAEAAITNPTSPAHRDFIGDRAMEPILSNFITTVEQAQELATSQLQIAALEAFEVSLESIVAPWLEAGEVVTFLDPSPCNADDATQYFLHNFTVPLALEPMALGARRIVSVQ